MDLMEAYRRAHDGVDAMLAAVPPEMWEAPSACPGWTLRDVAGHIIWGQEQMRHWATGQDYTVTAGARPERLGRARWRAAIRWRCGGRPARIR